jgi:hypothetical protein
MEPSITCPPTEPPSDDSVSRCRVTRTTRAESKAWHDSPVVAKILVEELERDRETLSSDRLGAVQRLYNVIRERVGGNW